MKKILFIIIGLFIITGCSSKDSNILNGLKDNIEKSKSYKMIGKMELRSDEEVFYYDINVGYLKNDNYIVEMLNTTNDHKQIILKNEDGLYVITPSLNKSFKFESTWPDNSSQAYILSSLIKDIEKDDKSEVIKDDNNIVIKCKVNYPNNKELTYQKIYIDLSGNVKKIEVYSESDLIKILVTVTDLDLNAGLKKSEFELSNFIDKQEDNSSETMGKIENAIYPLYIPSKTYLSSSEVVNNEESNRVILTFSGNKNFVIVEQTSKVNDEHEIIPVYGEPIMLENTIAALSNNSMYWTANDIDYYLLSNDLTVSEMVFVATSLGNSIATIAQK